MAEAWISGFCRQEWLIDLVNLHVVIDGQIGIANGGTCWRGLMAGADAELFAGALNRIGVSVAPRARHGQITGRCELAERSATAIQSDESALGGSDLQQIRTYPGQGDGLRWSCSFVSRGHLLKIKMKGSISYRGGDENNGQSFHTAILGLCEFTSKRRLLGRCITKQQCRAFAPRRHSLLINCAQPPNPLPRCSAPFRTDECLRLLRL